jgi:LmbE family N-acetylglucosaminyl deacetylase
VWSCGGHVAALRAAGGEVTLVTCFTADPERPSDAAWRAALRPSLRRTEDRAAARALDVRLVQLGLVEAGLRTTGDEPRYARLDDLFGVPAEQDEGLVEQLSSLLVERLREAERVYVPLAVSSHVDHVLVRRAVQGRVPPAALRYYEEFPYPVRAVEPALRPLVVPVPLEPWLSAALRYHSQVVSLFGSPARFRRALTDWACAPGDEIGQPAALRLWIPQAST